jgi:hypothetical protein
MIGVAVASQNFKVLVPEEWELNGNNKTNVDDEDQDEKNDSVLEFPADKSGMMQLLDLAKDHDDWTIVIAGNYNWAKPLASGLVRFGAEVRYVAPRRAERGAVQSQVRFLKNALANGVRGRQFFGERHKTLFPPQNGNEEIAHPWIELDNRRVVVMDDLRRVKHWIINQLRVIFPELISLETKLWGKKAMEALVQGNYAFFRERYELDYSDSLGRYMSGYDQEQAKTELSRLWGELATIVEQEKALDAGIKRVTGGHAIMSMFEDSDSARRLTLLIGWRTWGRTKDDFRQLRKYAGLAVSRIDSKGKPRISRERPSIRTNLYFFLRTSEGKRIIEEAAVRLGREVKTMKRPKRMEILLKEIWRRCLQDK